MKTPDRDVKAKGDSAKVLNDAADLIEKRGWFRLGWRDGAPDDYSEKPGAECALTAVGSAVFHLGLSGTALVPAEAAFRSLYGQDFDDYNDTPGRTKEEVVAALRAAASSVPSAKENVS